MSARPVTLLTAVALLAVIGSAFAFAGVLLLVLASTGLGLLAPAGGFVALLGAAAALAAILAAIAIAGLWRGRAWGWAASLAVAVVSVLGALVALATGGIQLPLVAGLALTVAALALLLAQPTRSAAGIG
jgi:hypothetical protein